MDDTSRRVDEYRNAREMPQRTASESPADPDTEQRTREIRQEIEQTRGELSETIDAIQEKLRPSNMVAQATERVKAATTEKVREMADTMGDTAHDMMNTTRDTAGGIAETVRQNPIPAVMLGLGAAWLLMSGSRESGSAEGRSRQSRRPGRGNRDATYPTARYGATASEDDSYGSGFADRLRDNPVPTVLAGVGLGWLVYTANEDRGTRQFNRYNRYEQYGGIARTGGVWSDRQSSGDVDVSGQAAGERFGASVSDSAEKLASGAKEYADEATEIVRQRGRQAQNQLQRVMQDAPLLVGAGALLLGAAFGLAVPKTDTEDEWMGEARDTMMGRAQDIARNAATQVEQAATQLTETITKDQG